MTPGIPCRNCARSWRGAAQVVRHEPDQECAERHEHCESCGAILSRGDWDAPPIATYTVPLSGSKPPTRRSEVMTMTRQLMTDPSVVMARTVVLSVDGYDLVWYAPAQEADRYDRIGYVPYTYTVVEHLESRSCSPHLSTPEIVALAQNPALLSSLPLLADPSQAAIAPWLVDQK